MRDSTNTKCVLIKSPTGTNISPNMPAYIEVINFAALSTSTLYEIKVIVKNPSITIISCDIGMKVIKEVIDTGAIE